MSIFVTHLDHTAISAADWDAFTSTDGWVRIVNHGPCAMQISQATSPPTENLGSYPAQVGIFLNAGDSVLVPSDDGTSGSRISMYPLTDSYLLDNASQSVSIISNQG